MAENISAKVRVNHSEERDGGGPAGIFTPSALMIVVKIVAALLGDYGPSSRRHKTAVRNAERGNVHIEITAPPPVDIMRDR